MNIADALTRFLEHIRSFFPMEDRGRITISTVHRYKGLERRAVVILDAIDRSYPLIHPNWVFLRIFGDNIESIIDEERRLFYVAITRAQKSLALVTETAAQSPYIADITRSVHIAPVSWNELPPVSSLDGARLEIRVSGNTFPVKDLLKDLQYRWDSESKCWRRSIMAEGTPIFDVFKLR